ncbi:hypothetical protein [Solwaraspora sp. WMMA2065]|uniref:hypothetical protein n=1 Tax=Solwaraspora sp. WMMA2065 TaxID=3015166 RepID=UPI00259AEF8E|nr:hypothetical protein [Solwaraspora sp. WMMA2065]WJK33277.1 hypothetical protein O7610_21635 [Solwaraspora sp. WMMA2065]
MDYREWEYGDRPPRERRSAARWPDDTDTDPVTRSRRPQRYDPTEDDEAPRGRRRYEDRRGRYEDRRDGARHQADRGSPATDRWALPAGPTPPTGEPVHRDPPAGHAGRHRDESWQIPEQPVRGRRSRDRPALPAAGPEIDAHDWDRPRRAPGRRRAAEDPISGSPVSGDSAGWRREPPDSRSGPVSGAGPLDPDGPATAPPATWSSAPARWSTPPSDPGDPGDREGYGGRSRRSSRRSGQPSDADRPGRRRRDRDDIRRRLDDDHAAQWLRDDEPASRWSSATDHTSEWSRDADHTSEWSRGADHTSEWSRGAERTGGWPRGAERTGGWPREADQAGRWDRPARREIEPPRREFTDETGTWPRAASSPRAIGAGPAQPPTRRARELGRGAYRPEPVDSWREIGDQTDQWHRGDDPESWPAGSRTGARKRRAAEVGDVADVLPPVDPWPQVEPGREGTFWSGTRLAADDPRWVETPASAPRSPIALPSAPRSRVLPEQRPRPRYEPPSQRRLTYRIDDELIDADQGGYLSSLLYTAAWYALPVVAFLIWSLTLDGTPATNDCVLGVDGDCLSARAQAINSLLAAAPAFAYALMISLVLAVTIRWVSGTWRASSVGLAAAVIGGGMSTVLASAITGQPIG